MLSKIEQLVSQKNLWLSQQVDVEFPTPESIAGRDIYLQSQQSVQYQHSELQRLQQSPWVEEVIEVDFHRLTIMFSVLQASNWSDNPEQQSLIIEFLTQIILDSEYQLYLGFIQGEAVAALICRVESSDNIVLLSDIVVSEPYKNQNNEQAFISDVLNELLIKQLKLEHVIHPISA